MIRNTLIALGLVAAASVLITKFNSKSNHTKAYKLPAFSISAKKPDPKADLKSESVSSQVHRRSIANLASKQKLSVASSDDQTSRQQQLIWGVEAEMAKVEFAWTRIRNKAFEEMRLSHDMLMEIAKIRGEHHDRRDKMLQDINAGRIKKEEGIVALETQADLYDSKIRDLLGPSNHTFLHKVRGEFNKRIASRTTHVTGIGIEW